jgi:hypothetical protein
MRNPRIIVGGSSVLLLVASCGGHDHLTATPAPPPGPTTQSISTADVLAQARQPSETTEPYAVGDDAIKFTDTSEETEPVSVNGA